ncbi:uncharacterized protein V6R79_026035 [Siganus canaliculatus]
MKLPDDSSPESWCFPGLNGSCVGAQLDPGVRLGLYSLFVAGMLLTVLGNSLVIVALCHVRQLQNPTNVLILSLALVDLLVGAVVMPFSAVRTVAGCWYHGDAFCLLHSTFDVFLTTLSIFHLIWIAVDRHQAICRPLLYARRVTASAAAVMASCSWALAAVYAFGLLYSGDNVAGLEEHVAAAASCRGACSLLFNRLWSVLDSVICFFAPCAAMIALYAQVFVVARAHLRQIAGERGGGGERSVKASECKAAKTLAIVLGAFICCWLPFFVTSMADAFGGFGTPPPAFEAVVWLGYFNSALNPVIYALFYPSFRRRFHAVVTLKICSSG